MKFLTIILLALAGAAIAKPAQANDSLFGRYSCELSDAILMTRALDLRESGYVFIDVDLAGVTGKRVGTFEVDDDYVVINTEEGYQLFLIDGARLVSESLGVTGECVRAVDSVSTASNQLEGHWQAKEVGLRIRFGEDGVAESTFMDEPVIKGNWEQLSPDSIAMTFRGSSESAANSKVYTFEFKSSDVLELRSNMSTTIVFDRIQ